MVKATKSKMYTKQQLNKLINYTLELDSQFHTCIENILKNHQNIQ